MLIGIPFAEKLIVSRWKAKAVSGPSAYAERFVREARETLDNFILFGQSHLECVVKQIAEHHNTCRPHQGIGNKIPLDYQYPSEPASPKTIKRKAFLGGLLNHYYVDKAA